MFYLLLRCVQFSYNPDPGTLEEVTSNSISNTVQFHVKNPTYEAWVEDDFNKVNFPTTFFIMLKVYIHPIQFNQRLMSKKFSNLS